MNACRLAVQTGIKSVVPPPLPPSIPPFLLLFLLLLFSFSSSPSLTEQETQTLDNSGNFIYTVTLLSKRKSPMWTICHSSLRHPVLVSQSWSCDFPQPCWKAQGEGTSKPPIPKFKEQPWDLMLGVVWLFWQRFFCGFKNFLKQEANIYISFEQNSTKSYVAFVYRDRLNFKKRFKLCIVPWELSQWINTSISNILFATSPLTKDLFFRGPGLAVLDGINLRGHSLHSFIFALSLPLVAWPSPLYLGTQEKISILALKILLICWTNLQPDLFSFVSYISRAVWTNILSLIVLKLEPNWWETTYCWTWSPCQKGKSDMLFCCALEWSNSSESKQELQQRESEGFRSPAECWEAREGFS